jgi:hypothetical protein
MSAVWRQREGLLVGPTRTSQHVRSSGACGDEADIDERMPAVAIYEYAPYRASGPLT